MKRLAATALFILLPTTLSAQDQPPAPEQSFRSCSLITSELLTAAQFHQQGLTLKDLKESLPTDSEKAIERIEQIYALIEKEGMQATVITLNGLYQRCAQGVYDKFGAPPRTSTEFGFYYCSGENKLRHEILQAHAQGQTLDQALQATPTPRHTVAKALYATANQHGILRAYQDSASELKSCLNEVLGIASESP